MSLRFLLLLLCTSWLLPASGGGFSPFSRFFLSRHVTQDAYVLDIALQDLKPEQVRVEVQPPWLIIRADRSRAEQQATNFPDGRGFVQHYRYVSGQQTRRVTLPPDANADALKREDRTGYIRIWVPRSR